MLKLFSRFTDSHDLFDPIFIMKNFRMLDKTEISVSKLPRSSKILISSHSDQKLLDLSDQSLRSNSLLKYGSFFYLLLVIENENSKKVKCHEIYETAENDLIVSDKLPTPNISTSGIELIFSSVQLDMVVEKSTIEFFSLRRLSLENVECRKITVRQRKDLCTLEKSLIVTCSFELTSAVGVQNGRDLEIFATTDFGLVRLNEYSKPCVLLTGEKKYMMVSSKNLTVPYNRFPHKSNSAPKSKILLLGYCPSLETILFALLSNNLLRIFKYAADSLQPINHFLTPGNLLESIIRFDPESEMIYALQSEKVLRISLKDNTVASHCFKNVENTAIVIPFLVHKNENEFKSEILNDLSYLDPNFSLADLREKISESRRNLMSVRQRQKSLSADLELIRHLINFSKNIDSPVIEVETGLKMNFLLFFPGLRNSFC